MGHRPSCAPVVLRYTIYDIYEACDERARAAEAAASGHTPAAGDPGDGAADAQPAGQDEDEQPKRKRQRVRSSKGRSGYARSRNDD